MSKRTLEDIERDYEKAKSEAEPFINARDEAVHKCNVLLKEMEDYKIQNGLYHPMSYLKNYKGRDIIHIKLVERDKTGSLKVNDMWNDEYFSIDENGYLDYLSYERGIMDYDKRKGKYIYSYRYCETERDFVGYLDICLEDEEENEN